jgi:hypothetical protein
LVPIDRLAAVRDDEHPRSDREARPVLVEEGLAVRGREHEIGHQRHGGAVAVAKAVAVELGFDDDALWRPSRSGTWGARRVTPAPLDAVEAGALRFAAGVPATPEFEAATHATLDAVEQRFARSVAPRQLPNAGVRPAGRLDDVAANYDRRDFVVG